MRSFADGYFVSDTNLHDLSLCVRTTSEVQERSYKTNIETDFRPHFFECLVGYLRYGCDHYTFGVRVAEISLFEYSIFGHLIWGNGLTVKDVLIEDLVHISKFVKIYSWQARKIRNILQAGDNYSAVLLLTEPNKVTQIILLEAAH